MPPGRLALPLPAGLYECPQHAPAAKFFAAPCVEEMNLSEIGRKRSGHLVYGMTRRLSSAFMQHGVSASMPVMSPSNISLSNKEFSTKRLARD